MDAIQFGKWISERRRRYGWSSQRALVETMKQDPTLQEWRISEDFIARLEAGRLSHPFRGQVRLHILALAWLLCKNTRELQTYLHAASLKELSSEEAELVRRLHEHLSVHHSLCVEMLPVRPARLIGRDALLHDLLNHLCTLDSGLCAITGMPGVGKSVLAYEVMHRMAAFEHKRFFQDGIITLSCKGRCGIDGLIALLNEIIEIFSSTYNRHAQGRSARGEKTAVREQSQLHAVPTSFPLRGSSYNLASAIDYVRMMLADKSVLFLLDEVGPQFPLREALDALFGHAQNGKQGVSGGHARRVVLTTSRHVPAPSLVNYHYPVDPLEAEDAVNFFNELVTCSTATATSMDAEECVYVKQICEALGYLPLAIESAAKAVAIEGIPLALLAANVALDPLNNLLDSDEKLYLTFEQAFQSFEHDQQTRFALLAVTGPYAFTLEAAAALYARIDDVRSEVAEMSISTYRTARGSTTGTLLAAEPPLDHSRASRTSSSVHATVDSTYVSLSTLTEAALTLGRFVSHSLLQRVTDEENLHPNNPRYRMHPLLYAYARILLRSVAIESVHQAEHNMLSYAEAYLERYQGDIGMLEREQEFLLDALEMAWRREDYAYVMRFSAKLSVIIGRMNNMHDGEYVLRRGIQASQQVQDNYYRSYLLCQLGLLYCYQGKLDVAREHWQLSLSIAEDTVVSAYLWRPYLHLAHLEYLQDNVQAAYDLTNVFLQRVQKTGDLRSLATGYLQRSFYQRLLKDIDHAYDDVCSTLSLLFMLGSDVSSFEQLLELEARAELARIIGDYSCAMNYVENALELADHISNPYIRAMLLLNQAYFARESGVPQDAHTLARRALNAAPLARHLNERISSLL